LTRFSGDVRLLPLLNNEPKEELGMAKRLARRPGRRPGIIRRFGELTYHKMQDFAQYDVASHRAAVVRRQGYRARVIEWGMGFAVFTHPKYTR